ncbi:hypothetical protein [Mucilaginibacter sp.]
MLRVVSRRAVSVAAERVVSVVEVLLFDESVTLVLSDPEFAARSELQPVAAATTKAAAAIKLNILFFIVI